MQFEEHSRLSCDFVQLLMCQLPASRGALAKLGCACPVWRASGRPSRRVSLTLANLILPLVSGIYQHSFEAAQNARHGFPVYSVNIEANHIQVGCTGADDFRIGCLLLL